MKKVILIFVTIVLSGLLYAKDNKSTDALLREIDGIIKTVRPMEQKRRRVSLT